MTKSNKVQNYRFNTARDEQANKLFKEYGSENLRDDFIKYIGSRFRGSEYRDDTGADLGFIIKSGDFNKKGAMDNMLNTFITDWKDDLNNYLGKTYDPGNTWLNNYWNNSAGSDLVNNYISSKYNDALDQLDRALKRGFLNETSYNKALDSLNMDRYTMETTANSELYNILDTYEQELLYKQGEFGTEIDNATLNNYDQMQNGSYFSNQLDDIYARQDDGFEGNVMSALSDLGGFDVSSILADSLNKSGLVGNNQTSDLLQAQESTNKKKENQIGLGNQGMF